MTTGNRIWVTSPANALRLIAALALLGIIVLAAPAQVGPVNGMRPAEPRAHAIVDATVIAAPGPENKLEHATIIIRDGLIEQVGPKDQVTIPADARIWKGEGFTIYPGLIESALMISPGDAATGGVARGPGAHWNAKVRPELAMIDLPGPDQALRKDLRGLGFTAAAVYPSTGAIRGTGMVMALGEESQQLLSYRDRAAMAMAFDFGRGRGGGPPQAPQAPGQRRTPGEVADRGERSERGYPASLMGAIALIRQALYDSQWHAACLKVWQDHPDRNEPPARADALVALGDVLASQNKQQVLFDVEDELNALRAAKLAGEFNLDMMLLGSGYEFRRLNEIIETKMPVIVPLEFPRRPDVSSPYAADSVSLRDLMTWEQAPTNPRRLINAAAPQSVALTTHRLRSRADFHPNLRNAIKHGLTEDQALAALTTTPAKLMGLENVLGTIAPGKAANLVMVKGNLFDKEMKVHDTWVNGRRYEVFKDPQIQFKGAGTLTVLNADGEAPVELPVEVDSTKSTLAVTLPGDEKKKVSAKKFTAQQDQFSFVMEGNPFETDGYVQFAGVMEGAAGSPPQSVSGVVVMPDGSQRQFAIQIQEQTEVPASQPEGENDKPDSDQAEQPAERQDGPAAADPVSGSWSVRSDQMPEGMSVMFNLRLERGTAVSGSVDVMGQAIDFTGGSFDPGTGKLAFSFSSPQAGATSIDANVSGDSMTGRVTSTTVNGDFSASKMGATDVAEGEGRGGRGRGRGGRGGRGAAADDVPFIAPPEELNYPLGEYGLSAPPASQNLLVRNATIWTSGPEGIIQDGYMIVRDGKIDSIGSSAETPVKVLLDEYITIDAQGKHITPGLIDCHSHTGISGGVNEGTQANTAEVRISDCIDPDDIDFYRQLAGGLVAANQLHGSANPIGGQNSVIKLKWGSAASEFPIKDAVGGIKFALGENVKRSSGRYPNSRMGVETFIRDAFTAAREYKAAQERYAGLSNSERAHTMPPQRDLELEALVEILDRKRIVHCHSYRQDEILMLIRLADAFGFTIGTFQHVLEGYKVADAIAKHGAGASSFSDWWAYKVEVMDAIPYNGSLMTEVGVLVSFNSDSDELARRMNTEASKAVRYGNLPPEEALKFVTINPAKQLRIDDRIGSLEVGKDADFVIWSGDPLSTSTRCEQTWIDGARHFSLEEDAAAREHIQKERTRIVQKILTQTHGELKKDEPSTQPATAPAESQPQTQPQIHITAKLREWLEEQVRLGFDPTELRPGDCGCGEFWGHAHD